MTIQTKNLKILSPDESTDQLTDPSSAEETPEEEGMDSAQFLFAKKFSSTADIILH
jgi:hypothetical protein